MFAPSSPAPAVLPPCLLAGWQPRRPCRGSVTLRALARPRRAGCDDEDEDDEEYSDDEDMSWKVRRWGTAQQGEAQGGRKGAPAPPGTALTAALTRTSRRCTCCRGARARAFSAATSPPLPLAPPFLDPLTSPGAPGLPLPRALLQGVRQGAQRAHPRLPRPPVTAVQGGRRRAGGAVQVRAGAGKAAAAPQLPGMGSRLANAQSGDISPCPHGPALGEALAARPEPLVWSPLAHPPPVAGTPPRPQGARGEREG